MLVGKGGSARRGIDRNRPHERCEVAAGIEYRPDGLFEPFQIVERVLAELIYGCIAVQPLLPAGIVMHRFGSLFARMGIDENRSDRVRTVVQTDDV